MLDAIRRILGTNPHRRDERVVAAWARSEGHELKRVRDHEGFVIEGHFDDRLPWRLEWGVSQRAYIVQRELRLRIEALLPTDLQMLVLNRTLAEKLERETFEQFTQSTQTYVDTSAPEEMRWLATFSRAPLSGTKLLRKRVCAVALEPRAASAWLDQGLASRLGEPASVLLADDPPLVLMTLRGRVYLRVEMPRAKPALLAEALTIGAAAVVEAQRISRHRLETGEWPAGSAASADLASVQTSSQ